MTIDISYLRDKLAAEKKRLTDELATFAEKISEPGQKENWEARPDQDETDIEFRDEYGAAAEGLEERQAAEEVLEKELQSTEEALGRIEAGTYGQCSVCGETIETERLNAEPMAKTCIAHKTHA